MGVLTYKEAVWEMGILSNIASFTWIFWTHVFEITAKLRIFCVYRSCLIWRRKTSNCCVPSLDDKTGSSKTYFINGNYISTLQLWQGWSSTSYLYHPSQCTLTSGKQAFFVLFQFIILYFEHINLINYPLMTAEKWIPFLCRGHFQEFSKSICFSY